MIHTNGTTFQNKALHVLRPSLRHLIEGCLQQLWMSRLGWQWDVQINGNGLAFSIEIIGRTQQRNWTSLLLEQFLRTWNHGLWFRNAVAFYFFWETQNENHHQSVPVYCDCFCLSVCFPDNCGNRIKSFDCSAFHTSQLNKEKQWLMQLKQVCQQSSNSSQQNCRLIFVRLTKPVSEEKNGWTTESEGL